MDKQSAHILVVTPHPDDAEYGVAGTVAQWTNEGKTVVYVVCTNGNKGTSDRELKPEKLIKIREREQIAAANLLGVKEVIFLEYPDQELEETPQFRKEIVKQIRRFRPEIVVTADPYRGYIWHRDHRITGRVVLDAVFPYARDHLSYPDLLEEGLEPHNVKEVLLWASENINYRSDITDTFSLKLNALRAHISQVGHIPRQKLEGYLRERATKLAEGEKYQLAEGFHREEITW